MLRGFQGLKDKVSRMIYQPLFRTQKRVPLPDMATDRSITLDAEEQQVRDFLVGAAEQYSKSRNVKVPVLRFAGGWVRDKLLKGESKDIDVAIDCMSGKDFYMCMKEYDESQADHDPESMTLGRLAEIKKDAEKSKHLETANTKLYGLELDLVNLRTETYHEDSRNPEMEIGTAEEDALRRDATINALFYNLNTTEVEDFTNRGLQDLEAKIMRTPLDPEQTFRDDPLRILRLIRFACRLDFEIEANALHWMQDKSIQIALEKKISRERILVELQKMLQGPRPRLAMEYLLGRNLFSTIFTIPGAEEKSLPVLDLEREGNVLDELELLINPKDTPSIIRRMLLDTKQEQYWAWLLAALVPWLGRDLPVELVKKGAPKTFAARIARDGLKIDNETIKVVSSADTHAKTGVREQVLAFSKQGAEPSSPSKRKLATVDRVSTGILIRKWGEHWHSIAIAALLADVSAAGGDAEAKEVKQRYDDWLAFIDKEKLDRVWDSKEFKPILNGTEIVECVKAIKGPWMTEATAKVFEYQLREQEEASAEGAKAAILEAVERGEIKVPVKGARK